MGIRDWFTRRHRVGGAVEEWRTAWAQAVASRDPGRVSALRAQLAATPPMADDLEVEHEMLDALEQLLALSAELDRERLPTIDTTHRVVGADVCHFSAPASLPDDASQASGRVLLTSRRALFVGGAKLTALPWHSVREVAQVQRDLVLIRSTEDGVRFRFNTFGDALTAAALARHLRRK